MPASDFWLTAATRSVPPLLLLEELPEATGTARSLNIAAAALEGDEALDAGAIGGSAADVDEADTVKLDRDTCRLIERADAAAAAAAAVDTAPAAADRSGARPSDSNDDDDDDDEEDGIELKWGMGDEDIDAAVAATMAGEVEEEFEAIGSRGGLKGNNETEDCSVEFPAFNPTKFSLDNEATAGVVHRDREIMLPAGEDDDDDDADAADDDAADTVV